MADNQFPHLDMIEKNLDNMSFEESVRASVLIQSRLIKLLTVDFYDSEKWDYYMDIVQNVVNSNSEITHTIKVAHRLLETPSDEN